MSPSDDVARLDRYFDNIASTALADLRTLASHDGGMGVFYLGTPIIDALARASTTTGDYWKTFMTEFMPGIDALRSYRPLAELMYREFRNPATHSLSASSRFRFTSGIGNEWLHLAEIDGIWHLHAQRFSADVQTAFDELRNRTKSDARLRSIVLARFDKHPPVGPVRAADLAEQIGKAAARDVQGLSAADVPNARTDLI